MLKLDLLSRCKASLLTFRYDFNQDDEVTKEDVRIVLSYAHFERNRQRSVMEVNKSTEGSYYDQA